MEKWTRPFSVALHTQSNIMCMKHVQVFLYFVVCMNRIIENVHKTCTYRHVQDFVCACVTSLTTYVNTKVLAQIKLHVFNVHNHGLCTECHLTWIVLLVKTKISMGFDPISNICEIICQSLFVQMYWTNICIMLAGIH